MAKIIFDLLERLVRVFTAEIMSPMLNLLVCDKGIWAERSCKFVLEKTCSLAVFCKELAF